MDNTGTKRRLGGRKLLFIILVVVFILFVAIYALSVNRGSKTKLYSGDAFTIQYPADLQPEEKDSGRQLVFKQPQEDMDVAITRVSVAKRIAQNTLATPTSLAKSLTDSVEPSNPRVKSKVPVKTTINGKETILVQTELVKDNRKTATAYVFNDSDVWIITYSLGTKTSAIEDTVVPLLQTFQIT